MSTTTKNDINVYFKKLITKLAAALTVAFVFLPTCLQAQETKSESTAATLFGGNKEIRVGGYGAFETRVSQLDDGFGMLVGGRGGVIIDNVFSVGLAGYGFLPIKKIDCPIPGHEAEINSFWTGGYGGLFFEYINSSDNLLHFSANTLIGAGGVTYLSHNNYNRDRYFDDHPVSVVFVLEPGVAVDLNVMRYFRMSLGVSYRYSPNFKLTYSNSEGNELDVVPKTAFNGISANLVFKFGEF